MMIEQTSDGWLIEYRSRFYHLNRQWLNDMYRHQVKPYGNNPQFNLLRFAFSKLDKNAIEETFENFIKTIGGNKVSVNTPDPTPLHQFMKEQRADHH